MKEKTAIKTNGLTKAYAGVKAVDSLNLEIREGELFALLGVNGAGKTTTIRMLTGLSAPTGGSAELYGKDIKNDIDEIKKMVGISTQDTAVADNLTVEENLRFMAGIYLPGKENKNKAAERVEEIIKTFKLDEVRSKKAKTLSGGWQRKLSIAMAVIGEPKILFLDEPTLGLDVLARRELWKAVEVLKKSTTIILTTHYMEEAEALADRIGIMIKGHLVKLGTLEELEKETGKKGLEDVFVTVAEQEEA
jgi:ABC-type multidrug transport system, ATPase component